LLAFFLLRLSIISVQEKTREIARYSRMEKSGSPFFSLPPTETETEGKKMDCLIFVLYCCVTGYFAGLFLDEIKGMKDEQKECQQNAADQEKCWFVYKVWYLNGVYEVVKNGEGVCRVKVDE
jgi:hypothetical protein